MRFVDLTGQRFGRLTVFSRAASRNGGTYWNVKCDCGNTIIARSDHLRRNLIRSCKCLAAEESSERNTIHGFARPGARICEHWIWTNMIERCADAGNKNYCGRGIIVCERWVNSFEKFLSDMGNRPSPQHSLERRDNDGNYEPTNVYWATAKDQARNTRRTVLVDVAGERLCLKDATEKLGLPYAPIATRIRRGWPIEQALNTPVVVGAKWRK